MEGFDAIACTNEVWKPDLVKMLRPLSPEELAATITRPGHACLKEFVTVYLGGVGASPYGWPPSLYKTPELGVLSGKRVAARAYRQAPEFVPSDFKWEPVPGMEGVFGGTLIDASKRL